MKSGKWLRYWCSQTYHMSLKASKNTHLLIFCHTIFFFLNKNHYAPVSQANWCNMTFRAGNLFPYHSCIVQTWVKPPPGSNPGSPQWELDDLPTELSPPLFIVIQSLIFLYIVRRDRILCYSSIYICNGIMWNIIYSFFLLSKLESHVTLMGTPCNYIVLMFLTKTW